MILERRAFTHLAKVVMSSLLFLMLFWTTSALAQSPPSAQEPPSSVESSPGGGTQGSVPADSPQRSRIDGWFNRSGSGLFVSLTPFATTVTLFVLLLLILLPFLLRAVYRRGKRGYFTVYARQRRYA